MWEISNKVSGQVCLTSNFNVHDVRGEINLSLTAEIPKNPEIKHCICNAFKDFTVRTHVCYGLMREVNPLFMALVASSELKMQSMNIHNGTFFFRYDTYKVLHQSK